MQRRHFVPLGQCVWSTNPNKLFCKGLGSCVAVCLYDDRKRAGGLAHILLPFGANAEKPYLYANLGLSKMVEELRIVGAVRDRIWAKIAGGANIFGGGSAGPSIGQKNIDAVRHWLRHFDVPVRGEDVGGDEGRNVVFDLANGELAVYTIRRGDITI